MLKGCEEISQAVQKEFSNAALFIKKNCYEPKCIGRALLITGLATMALGITIGLACPILNAPFFFIAGPFIFLAAPPQYIGAGIVTTALGTIAGYPLAQIGAKILNRHPHIQQTD